MNAVETFFSEPNQIKPGEENSTSLLAAKSVQSQSDLVVLPWQEQQEMRWYVLIPSDKPFEQIREEVVAHVGVSYTNYRGQITGLNPEDTGDEKVLNLLGDRRCIRVDSAGEKFHTVSKAFERFLSFWEVRPQLDFLSARSLTETLNNFRMAVQAGRRDEAEKAKEEARGLGLDAINQAFMNLEMKSVFEGPEAVLNDLSIRDVIEISPRPTRVTDLLAQAIDRVYLRPTDDLSVEQIKSNFVDLHDSYKRLLTSSGQVRSPSGLLLLVLDKRSANVSLSMDDLKVPIAEDQEVNEILEILEQELQATQGAIEQNIETGSSTSSANSTIRQLFDTGAWDEILAFSVDNEPTADNLMPVILAAKEVDTITSAETALNFLERADTEIVDGLAQNIQKTLGGLRELVTGSSISDWNSYFEYLLHHPERNMQEIVDRGKQEWAHIPFIQNPENIKTLQDHLSTDGIDLKGTLPSLYEWLSTVPDEFYSLVLPVEETLLTYLSFNDTSNSGLDLMGQLARRIISSGVNQEEFSEVLDALEYRWSGSSSPSTVEWAADLIEVVIDHPCPDTGRATVFHSNLFQPMSGYFSRIERSLRLHLSALATELNLRDRLPEESIEETKEINVQEIKVGLYSLTETALTRARTTLVKAWPGLQVVTSSEKQATRELENLARTASLMVVGTGSAKHAATDCISGNRPKDKETKYIKGKGSAGFISAVESWLVNR